MINVDELVNKTRGMKNLSKRFTMILPALVVASQRHDFTGISGFAQRADWSDHVNTYTEGYAGSIFGCSHTDRTEHRDLC